MSQLKRIAWPRFLLLILTLFALSAIWPGTGSAAQWNDLLKKAEDLASDVVKDVLDDDEEEESDDDQEAAQETSPAATAPVPETPSVATQPAQPEIPVVSAEPDADKLKLLATFAGRYAAWRDICGDPDGADIRSDFLARAELLAPAEQAGIIQQFEKRYTKKKKNGEKSVENCIGQGETDCCTVGPAGRILGAKNLYDSHIASLTVAAVPAESAGSAAESAAVVPAPPVSDVSNKESVAAAPTSPTPFAPLPASSHIPATQLALGRIYADGGIYAGWAAACDEPITVKQDYYAAANSLEPFDRDHSISNFEATYGPAFDRVKRHQAMQSDPRTRNSVDPCTRDTLDHYKEKYETILLYVQKRDAAAKNQAVAATSTVVSGTSAARPVTVHEPGKGAWTLDGETRLLVFKKCSVFIRDEYDRRVDGQAKDQDGSTLIVKLIPGYLKILVVGNEPERNQKYYANRDKNTEVFRIDGSTVTVDAAFKTTSPPITGHSIQMSFDCSG